MSLFVFVSEMFIALAGWFLMNHSQKPDWSIRSTWISSGVLFAPLWMCPVYFLWMLIPASLFALAGVLWLVVIAWKPQWRKFNLLILGGLLFLAGFENLIHQSTRWTTMPEAPRWIFWFGENYFQGALVGVFCGFVLRALTGMKGVSQWSAAAWIFSGILSLGAGWGFFLGDKIFGAISGIIGGKTRMEKTQGSWLLVLSLGGLALTNLLQTVVLQIQPGAYSGSLRVFQWTLMMAVFLVLQGLGGRLLSKSLRI
ncbi:MAG: hypothetical protein COT73_08765 [Bdellovibrio sp. CG10_big_fil_rev_8_21_14_0_10_47_8]|nr:MAG: hypothetical protein COT73_08765 [Bdellovibrio sp. CG10_big_fil_rev_8_21_14_0_10_47_8]